MGVTYEILTSWNYSQNYEEHTAGSLLCENVIPRDEEGSVWEPPEFETWDIDVHLHFYPNK